jgi:hypothetical protein
MNRYRGVPKPPPEIWDELEAANASGDQTRIDAAEARTRAWAVANGYERPQGRPARADEAAR